MNTTTPPKLADLTDEQKRILIAESQGWRIDHSKDYDSIYDHLGRYAGGATHDFAMAIRNAGIPNYLRSLDAMHEAEKTLTDDELLDYWFHLANQVGAVDDDGGVYLSHEGIKIATAEAAARANSFLLAKGLAVP